MQAKEKAHNCGLYLQRLVTCLVRIQTQSLPPRIGEERLEPVPEEVEGKLEREEGCNT
jgi:hypothetical protein